MIKQHTARNTLSSVFGTITDTTDSVSSAVNTIGVHIKGLQYRAAESVATRNAEHRVECVARIASAKAALIDITEQHPDLVASAIATLDACHS